MISTLIVEDERNARIALRQIILEDCPELEIIGEADNVHDAISMIRNQKPALVFLDIQLHDRDSFEILQSTDFRSYHIIFTTAYQDHAIKAFKFSAIDYLLKPINREYLRNAVDRLLHREKRPDNSEKIKALLSNLESEDQKPRKIILSTQDMISVVDVADIIRCEADVNYTRFVIRGQEDLLISRTLKEFEEELSSCGFFRIHKSHLINLKFLKGYDRREGGSVILTDGIKLPLSVRKREYFLEVLKSQVL